ncbi:hypothetical protein [Pseudomonas fortuita]|uniref:hypothetical protein n=1 Tax=Pseudomonas fortuita TaxID=3233375 RepID=UPI003DA15BB5
MKRSNNSPAAETAKIEQNTTTPTQKLFVALSLGNPPKNPSLPLELVDYIHPNFEHTYRQVAQQLWVGHYP